MSFPYQQAFTAVEKTVYAASGLGKRELSTKLADYTFEPVAAITGSDQALWRKLVAVVYYSGVKAQIVTDRLPAILRHMGEFRAVAGYGKADEKRILNDEGMLRHPGKYRACVANAKRCIELVKAHGSLRNYLNAQGPLSSDEAVKATIDRIQQDFKWIGPITAYHYLMDLKVDVLKPDRVVQRIFHRFGLIADPATRRKGEDLRQFLFSAVAQGRRFSAATGKNIRLVDITFMAMGQEQIDKFRIEGTCLEQAPSCPACQARPFCTYVPPRKR